MPAHACKVDFSPETGSLVACTCGYVVGPFQSYKLALKEAGAHRRAHEPIETAAQRDERKKKAREVAAARRALRNR